MGVWEAPEYRQVLCGIRNATVPLPCSQNPPRVLQHQRHAHSWVIVLHQGPGACKASLRAIKPLWLHTHMEPGRAQQTRLRRTRKLGAEILLLFWTKQRTTTGSVHLVSVPRKSIILSSILGLIPTHDARTGQSGHFKDLNPNPLVFIFVELVGFLYLYVVPVLVPSNDLP